MFKKNTKITEIDSEKNNIYTVINNTKQRNINIVLIIDEAHREISFNKDDINAKQIIINELDPYKIIKVSATLQQVNDNPDYIITYEDVRQECAIKKSIEINSFDHSIRNIDKYSENIQLILSAIKKQKEVKKAYYKNNINIKPLIIIQIPDNVVIDKIISTEDLLIQKIEEFLEKNNYKRGINYAIWLDKLKTNKKEEILDNNSNIEILIFKQAIATGWDIPRANILIRIREAKTKAFNIQTLGRILRNPLFKYYDNNLIDNAFVYTKDEKYKEYIKQEEIVIDSDEFKIAPRSTKSKISNFNLKRRLLKPHFNKQELVDYVVDKIINNKNFLDFFNYDKFDIKIDKAEIDTKLVVEPNKNKIQNKIDDSINQQQLNLLSSTTLFDLYIKYKTITKSSELNSLILDAIANNLTKINKKIKDFYWACCKNWEKTKIKIGNQLITLNQLIEKTKNEFLNSNISEEYEDYFLPITYQFDTKKYNVDEWDYINTYEVSLMTKKLDSKNEEEFYKKIRDSFDDNNYIHLLRNGTTKNDYYTDYLDNETKIRKFYPDFILVNEKTKKTWIFEAKGIKNNDIDKYTEYKFDSMMELFEYYLKQKKINNEYHFKGAIKVSLDKDNLVFYNENGEKMEFRDLKREINKEE